MLTPICSLLSMIIAVSPKFLDLSQKTIMIQVDTTKFQDFSIQSLWGNHYTSHIIKLISIHKDFFFQFCCRTQNTSRDCNLIFLLQISLVQKAVFNDASFQKICRGIQQACRFLEMSGKMKALTILKMAFIKNMARQPKSKEFWIF